MTRFRKIAGKALATLGVAGLAVAGASGVALAADGWPEADEQGSIQIHKTANDEDKTDLEGVVFSATLLGVQDGENCVALDLTTQDGWKTANEAITKYNKFFQDSTTKPGHPGGPTAAEALAAAELCEAAGAETLGATGTDGLTQAKTVGKGLYLIQETSAGANVITKAAAPFIVAVPYPDFEANEDGPVKWVYEVVANAKNELTEPGTPDKTVNGTNEGGNWKPGAVQEWTITATVPKSEAGYESIAITDIPGGLTFEEFVSIKMGDVELKYTVSGNTATLDEDSLAKVNAAAKTDPVVLTVVVKTSVPTDYAGGALNNKATLNLNGKPGEPGGKDVTVWGQLKIEKVDKAGKPLTGAEFSVWPAANGACELPAPADALTQVKENELKTLWIYNGPASDASYSKDYCVLETKAPAGYVIDNKPHKVTVTVDATTVVTIDKVVNVPTEGPELPTTGANGTLLMTIGGVALMALAGGAYMVTRRKSAN